MEGRCMTETILSHDDVECKHCMACLDKLVLLQYNVSKKMWMKDPQWQRLWMNASTKQGNIQTLAAQVLR
jgi:hypothetical protein